MDNSNPLDGHTTFNFNYCLQCGEERAQGSLFCSAHTPDPESPAEINARRLKDNHNLYRHARIVAELKPGETAYVSPLAFVNDFGLRIITSSLISSQQNSMYYVEIRRSAGGGIHFRSSQLDLRNTRLLIEINDFREYEIVSGDDDATFDTSYRS